jgi:hypothetical protein
MTPMFKHLEPHEAPSMVKVPRGLAIAPAMQTVIVNRITVVDPQFAAVV